MTHTKKKYRPDPHAKYVLQLICLPLALILIAAIRYVLMIVPAHIVNGICLLLLLAALICIFILLPLWFRNTSYTITEQDIISVTGIFIHREKRMRLRALAMQHHHSDTILSIYWHDLFAATRIRRHHAASLSEKKGCRRALYSVC